jgi:RsiW-degrading membrane proteinase PrsW (M82 family)/ribosomal protein S18 acetylase RimI-like enzyme
MSLLMLTLAPGIAICLFILHRDAYNREPKLNLLVTFILGALSVYPAAMIERSLFLKSDSLFATAVTAFLIVALTEELCKFAVVRLYAYRKKSFDEPLDGIVYAVMASMGFATLENILYVTKFASYGMGYQVALQRMFFAVPAHGTFGVLMGYYTGKAKFDLPSNKTKWIIASLFWPVLFHGAYDFFLFLQSSPDVNEYISDGLLLFGAVVSFIVAMRFSFKHLSIHRRLSQKTYHPTEKLLLRRASAADIPLIRKLCYEIWPQTYVDILSKDQIDYMLNMMYSEQALQKDMVDKIEYVIIYDEKDPVGFASFGFTEPGICKLHKIYFLPSTQGKGFGRFTIEEIIKRLKLAGASALQLNVNRHNKAIGFYEKLGFVIIRQEDNDIGNGYFMNDYVMERRF